MFVQATGSVANHVRSQDVVELGYTPLLRVFLVREPQFVVHVLANPLVGRYGAQGGAPDMHTPAIHCQQALSVRSSLARPPTKRDFWAIGGHVVVMEMIIALDPGQARQLGWPR